MPIHRASRMSVGNGQAGTSGNDRSSRFCFRSIDAHFAEGRRPRGKTLLAPRLQSLRRSFNLLSRFVFTRAPGSDLRPKAKSFLAGRCSPPLATSRSRLENSSASIGGPTFTHEDRSDPWLAASVQTRLEEALWWIGRKISLVFCKADLRHGQARRSSH